MFLKVCSASPRMSGSNLFCFLPWVDFWFSTELIFFLFLISHSKEDIVILKDLGNFTILLILLLKLSELLFVANSWRANRIWSVWIVAGVFWLRNCGWFVERAFFCFFLTKFQYSSMVYLLEILLPSAESRLALNHLDYYGGKRSTQLRNKDHLGNNSQWVLSSVSRCTWMFPEQLRKKSEPVGSDEIDQV